MAEFFGSFALALQHNLSCLSVFLLFGAKILVEDAAANQPNDARYVLLCKSRFLKVHLKQLDLALVQLFNIAEDFKYHFCVY